MGRKKLVVLDVGSVYQSLRYGPFEVVRDGGWDDVDIRFLSSGYTQGATRSQVKKGEVMDRMRQSICGVGFIGGTKYKAKNGSACNPQYTRWTHMLRRCYDAKTQMRTPTYIGCSVAKEWHNFQNFAKWCEENHFDGADLDKDILVEGNKIYSPSTCKFVTHQENSEKAAAKNFTLISPTGEVVKLYNLSNFCKTMNLTRANIHKVLSGDRPHHKGWRAAKVAPS